MKHRSYAEALEEAVKHHGDFRKTDDKGAAMSAIDDYLFALRGDPTNLQIIMALGDLYSEVGEWGLGIALMTLAHMTDPRNPANLNNLAAALNRSGRTKEARKFYEEAIVELKASGELSFLPHLYNNIATTWVGNGTPGRCLDWCDRALEIDPAHPEAMWTKAQALLELGDFKRGWPLYYQHMRSRKQRTYLTNDVPLPRWTGKRGQNVILIGEQGVGDEVMFMQAAKDLIADCKHVVVDATRRLVPVFARSFPEATVFTSDTRVEGGGIPFDEPLDAYVYMGDLFYFYRCDGFGTPKPYIVANPDLKPRLEGFNVGIGWIGGAPTTRQQFRSIPLEQLAPIILSGEAVGATFHSLQYTIGAEDEVKAFNAKHGTNIRHDQDMIDDLEKQVAFISAMDMVATVCTAAVHFAGAQGVRTLVMAPRRSTWRYALASMPFYPDVDIVRQEADNEWGDVVKQVAAEVAGAALNGNTEAA